MKGQASFVPLVLEGALEEEEETALKASWVEMELGRIHQLSSYPL